MNSSANVLSFHPHLMFTEQTTKTNNFRHDPITPQRSFKGFYSN